MKSCAPIRMRLIGMERMVSRIGGEGVYTTRAVPAAYFSTMIFALAVLPDVSIRAKYTPLAERAL